jgi:hypothetical protein
MALTVNTYPNPIDNSGAFNVTTSLVEDASHVNLRVRLDVTVSSVVVATSEKPKGIAGYDISEILKAHVPGISFDRNSGVLYKVSGGAPLVAYTVLFTEVFEDSTGVTQTGETNNISGTTFKYVPASVDSFTEYVLHDTACLFANKTLRSNAVKFYPAVPYEYWLVFFTSVAHVELFYSKDGGAYDHSVHFDPLNGWGVIILNAETGGLMNGVTSNLKIQLGEVGGAKISEVITINVDSSAISERTILEFDGETGGKEYLAFEGIKDKSFMSIRNYYSGPKKNRKPLDFTGVCRQKLETTYKDINNAEYLAALLDSENVKRLELLYATAKDVTVLTDTVKTQSSELFTNPIEIEYAN